MDLAQFNLMMAERHKQIDREIDQNTQNLREEALLASKIYRKTCHVLEDARANGYDATDFAHLMAEQIGNIVTELVVGVSRDVTHAAQLAQAVLAASSHRAAHLISNHYENQRGGANAPTSETPN